MKINPNMMYFNRDGFLTVPLSVSDLRQLEDYVLDQVTQQTFPTQPGDPREWTPEQIKSKFDPERYLWGNTVRDGIVFLARACRAHDRKQRP